MYVYIYILCNAYVYMSTLPSLVSNLISCLFRWTHLWLASNWWKIRGRNPASGVEKWKKACSNLREATHCRFGPIQWLIFVDVKCRKVWVHCMWWKQYGHIDVYIYLYKYIHTVQTDITLHYITLYNLTLHFIIYITSHCIYTYEIHVQI